METLRKGLLSHASEILKQATALCTSPDPPAYLDEVLLAMDAQIIVACKGGDVVEVVQAMNDRMDMVSRWIGDSSSALARDMHRAACLYAAFGDYHESAKMSGEAIHIGSDHDDFDLLDSLKLLATSLDASNHRDAHLEYESALAKEEDPAKKACLMNALANVLIKGGETHLAVLQIEKSLEIQGGQESDLKFNTMTLYGNAMASKNDVTQAVFWYESILNSNPDKSALHPINLRAWYNKGVVLFRNNDIVGASHAFSVILDELEKSSTVAPGTGFILNAIGSIHFANKDYDGACEKFKKSLTLNNDELPPSQRAMTLCNIGTAYYKLRKYEESDANFNQALSGLKSEDSASLEFKETIATVKCKYACILYKRKMYLRAYNMFTEAAKMGSETASDFVAKCGGFAEQSRRNLLKKEPSHRLPPPEDRISAHTPQFGSVLVPITDRQNASRYTGAVFSQKRKILIGVGVELDKIDSIEAEVPSEDTVSLCNTALQNLLEKTKTSRNNYASDFEGLVDEKLNSKFVTTMSLLG